MTCHVLASRRTRAGITLTEILISILIMGIGLISLATLFPLGILRLRSAARDNRSTLLGESAISDMSTRNLLGKSSFSNPQANPWNAAVSTNSFGVNSISGPYYDPFVKDLGSYLSDPAFPNQGVLRSAGPGLPFCYDPFFRAFATNPNGPPDVTVNSTPGAYPGQAWGEVRFGQGLQLAGGATLGVGADGLQRLTNFDMTMPPRAALGSAKPLNPFYNTMLNTVASIFASPDDVITNSTEGAQANSFGGASPLLPDPGLDPSGLGLPTRDFSYSWFFTGWQTDASNPHQFDGSIVVCNNRPLAVDAVSVGGKSLYAPAGETTIHAIWGYGARITQQFAGQTTGYSAGGDRSVLLYWPNTMDDPEVKVGQWIADVTYQRLQGLSDSHKLPAQTIAVAVESLQLQAQLKGLNTNIPDFPVYEPQRSLWYQVIKRSDVTDGTIKGVAVRMMTVQVGGTLRSRTLLQPSTNSPSLALEPVFEEAALIMPSVVNVFPKSVSTR